MYRHSAWCGTPATARWQGLPTGCVQSNAQGNSVPGLDGSRLHIVVSNQDRTPSGGTVHSSLVTIYHPSRLDESSRVAASVLDAADGGCPASPVRSLLHL
jgi:hypothetical protein